MPTETHIKSVKEEQEELDVASLIYEPDEEEQELIDTVKTDWIDAYNQKISPYRHLNEDTLEGFWKKSRDHFNGYNADVDQGVNSWKSKAFKKKTRHQVIATVAGFVDSGIGLDFSAQNPDRKLDRVMSKTGEDLYEWSLEREQFDFKQFLAYIEQTITGTVHVYEEIAWDEREVKEIVDMDFKTGELKTEIKTRVEFKGCRAEVVPNDEIYPGDSFTFNIQEQPYFIRRKITTHAAAAVAFSRWKNWQYVKPGRNHFLPTSTVNEIEEVSDEDDSLEIVWWYRKSTDSMAILANGVLLTPYDYPIPYPHKNYPFAKGVFETFADTRFYWGDSLPNKNYDDQEMVNALWRSFMDLTALHGKPPLFTNVPELVNSDLVVPGLTAGIESADFKVQTIAEITKGVTQTEYNMLDRAENQISENGVAPVNSGQESERNQTATETRAIVGSADKMKGFNEQFISNWMVQLAHLRMPNLLWFLSHDEEYKEVVIDNVKTSTGANGKRKIKFVDAVDLPSAETLWAAEEILAKENKSTDFVFVNKEHVNDYRYHISMSATPKPRRTSTQKMTRAIEKYRFYSQNPQIDQKKNTEKLVMALGDDPDEMIMKAPPVDPAMAAMAGAGGKSGQMPGTTPLPKQNPQMAAAMGANDQLGM